MGMGSRRKEDWVAPGTQPISRVGEASGTPESTRTLQREAYDVESTLISSSQGTLGFLMFWVLLTSGLRFSSWVVEGSVRAAARSTPVKTLCPLSFSEREGECQETPSMAAKSSGPTMTLSVVFPFLETQRATGCQAGEDINATPAALDLEYPGIQQVSIPVF